MRVRAGRDAACARRPPDRHSSPCRNRPRPAGPSRLRAGRRRRRRSPCRLPERRARCGARDRPLPRQAESAVGRGDDGAPAERGQARIVADEAGLRIRSRGIIPAGKDARGARAVLDGGLGAQPVEAEPLGEVSRLRRAHNRDGIRRRIPAAKTMKSNRILPCGLSRAPKRGHPDRDAVEIAGQKAVEKAGLLAQT